MILKKLEIELQEWGENKGQYKGEISFVSANGQVTTFLNAQQIQKLLPVVADAVVASAKEVANILTSQVLDQKKILKVLESKE